MLKFYIIADYNVLFECFLLLLRQINNDDDDDDDDDDTHYDIKQFFNNLIG